ncbi:MULTISPECIES: DUF3781 domain-containing protein [unclassified Polaribacter]|uniref:DUF3781 domain-containing protein n=1 Tax=unclassified Polaribacter TaxID=196858 RepID=UPI001C4F029E|nr:MULTISPECIES: DUF3781 domain-containing protein [unclassified Polaribacter]QXP64132.1 DUF3781 domain-containing protein [Polaribacter sp. HaHaR_3_91]QXP66631.1 DUF3781 domain-containing protein [Polaribacter sp. AHE13PA]QXP72112.1 DUF3781 domain-containing protein [Polaribacter sp. R2A056_3_33]
MENNKNEILEKHCYTELVYQRINKKLKIALSKDETENFIRKVLEETVIENYLKKGKNFYISNKDYNVRITVNSNTFRIITVDRI